MADKEQINRFLLTLSLSRTESALIGSDIYPDVKKVAEEMKFDQPLTECDILGDKVMVFAVDYPLQNMATTIEQVLELDTLRRKISSQSPFMGSASFDDKTSISIVSKEGARYVVQNGKTMPLLKRKEG